jgi:uncharacterized repeat protein (TIGR01451 family)
MRRSRAESPYTRSPWSRGARSLASLLAFAVVVTGLSVVQAGSAEAAVVRWGTNSGTAPNYQANVNGDFLVAGNGVLACSAATDSAAGTCDNLHAASSTNTSNVNDNFVMSNANTVTGFTTNSSTASITIPSGATVSKAFLGWSANTGVFTGDARTLCTTYSAARGTATLPAGATTGYRTRAVQLKVGAAALQTVAPSSVLEDPTSQATALYYSATADVTAAFAGATTGSPIAVSAGNLWAPTGAGCYAGWSLTVIYDYGTFIPGNANSIPHRVIYYEGHVRQGASETPLTVGFSGFTAVDAGTRAGFTLFEGDRNIVGDTAQYSRQNSTTYTEIPNSAGATGNIGISRAIGSTRYTQTANTTAFTNQSVDVATAPLTNVVAGDTSVNLRLGTSGDSFLLTNAVLSVPTAGLQISKTFNGTADSQSRTATEVATFTVLVTNSGAGALRNIVLTDDQPDCARSLSGVVLQPQQTYTFTCTAAAASAATYVSTSTGTAYTVTGNYLASDEDSTEVLLSSLTLAKTSALAAGATGRAGDTVTYSFTVRNNGSSALTSVGVTDPLPGLSALTYTWPTATAGSLAAGQSATATATRVLTQSDVDAGSIANTATASGTDADGGPRPTATASRTTPLAAAPSISVTKSAVYASGATGRVGDRINYTFGFTNSGNVTLTNVALNDPLPGLSAPVVVWPGASGTLAPGQTATATATYVVRQSDVDRGSVTNQATVDGRTPASAAVTGTSPSVSLQTVAPAPALTTTKSGVAAGNAGVGQTITYSFRATNTGNVTLSGVAVNDPLAGLSARTYSWPGAAGVLAPGQFVTATATYVITQADVDAQSVRNIATTVATSPTGTAVTAASTESVVATVASAPALSFSKSGSLGASTGRAGDPVSYTFTLTNTGNVTMTGVGISDPLPGLSAPVFGSWPSGTPGTLAPGQSVTATAGYTLRQSDVDAGAVANTATATGRPPVGAVVVRTASATVPVTPTGLLAVTKSGALTSGTGGVGSTITYSFTIRNDGNVTLGQVALVDPLPGLSTPSITWPGAAGQLAPGATATATATYTVRQADVDTGAVRNTATATAATPRGQAVSAASPQSTFVTPAAAPAIGTTKTAVVGGGGAGNVGDVVTYTLRTTNTGNVTLTGVAVADPLPGLSAFAYSWPGTAGTLAPGQTVTATATYTIRQSDVNAGSVRNTSSAAADFGATRVTATSAPVTTTTVAAAPSLVTTKSGALATGATGRAGDTVNWTVTLRNSGNVTLTAVGITDALPGISAFTFGAWPGGTAGTLQPGQSVTATASYRLSQADVDSGAVVNSATGSATPPTGAAVTSTAPATVPLASGPALSVTKTGTVSGNGSVGDTVTFAFVVRNTGNVTVSSVALADSLPGLSPIAYGIWPGAPGQLAPGAQVGATATYVIRQGDVNAGAVRNTAAVTGTAPDGATVTAQSPQAVVSTAPAAPSITTTKTAAVSGAGAVGDVITYTIVSRNSGNVTLTGVTITDPLTGPLTLGAWPGGVDGQLQPATEVRATGTHVITQADVNAGAVRNTATSSATFGSTVVTGPSGQVVTPTQAGAPALSLTKDGALPAGSTGRAGDTVTYQYIARNTGNVTLTGVGVADAHPGLSPISYTAWPSGDAGVLQPGAQVTASATYVLTQADVDSGAVVNTARATGAPPAGSAVSADASETVALTAVGGITVTKTASRAGTGVAGDVVTFEFAITNPGTVTLSGVQLNDTLPGLSTPVVVWPGASGVLPPGTTATATASYVIRQADVDAGVVTNRASVTGRTPAGAVQSAQSELVSVPTAAAAPGLTVTKSAAPTSGVTAGSTITYSIGLTNSGNQTLSGVTLADSLPGLSALAVTWPGAAGVLAPGQTATARASYVVSQADVDRGSVSNTADATADAPGGVAIAASSPTAVTTAVAAAPSVSLSKTGTLAAGSTARAGDVVTYAFVVRNTGNVTVTAAGVTDPLPGLSAISFGAWPSAAGVLAPGQQVAASASYALSQADIDAGSVANTATARAAAPSGAPVESTAVATVPLAAGAALAVVKTGSVTAGNGSVGDTITFRFTVRNTGNVSLTGVGLADPLPGVSAIAYGSWPGAPGVLAPNAQVTASATYVITQADVDAGAVRNTVTASGTSPAGIAVSAASAPIAVATVAAGPSLDTTKSAAYTSGTGGVGSVLTYTLRAVNTGNVTLTGVVLSDPLPNLGNLALTWSGGTAGVLAPTEVVTGVATYTLTQADVDAGSIANTATATGLPPMGSAVSDASARLVTATAPAAPVITVDKTGSLPVGAPVVAGTVVTWSVVLSNDGNVTLTGVGATDALAGMGPLTFDGWPGPTGVLAPGQSVTGTAEYPITQQDIDAGAVVNTADGRGTPPTGAAATGTDTATVAVSSDARLTVGKSARIATPGTGAVGDTIVFTFPVVNTGNVTLTGVAVSDPLPGLSAIGYGTWPSGTVGTLAPGQQVEATASYVIRQSDVDVGVVANTASVAATTPAGTGVSAASPTVVTATTPRVATLQVSKSDVVSGAGAVGDTITYTLVARNAGSVSLTGLAVTDALQGLSPLVYGTWPGGVTGTLPPGSQVTATTQYRITQADVDRGFVSNTATATAASQVTPVVSASSPEVRSSTTAAAPDLTLTKAGALAAGSTGVAGDTLRYTFRATNSGNVSLSGVTLADPMPGLVGFSVVWPGAPGSLLPGQSATAAASYVLTQADVDAGSVSNIATSAATTPDGGTLQRTAPRTVALVAQPGLDVTKDAAIGGRAVGDEIDYTIRLRNTGNVTLTQVALVDALEGLSEPVISWPTGTPGTLPPGTEAVATASYLITLDDFNRGSVSNAATASAVTPNGAAVSDSSDEVVVATGTKRIELRTTKTATVSGTGAGLVGETVTYAFTVTNTGNVSLQGVTLDDPLLAADPELVFPGAAGELQPGAVATATATRVIAQTDVDAGSVVNTVTASGIPPAPDSVVTSPRASVTTPTAAATPAISVSKSGTAADEAGDEVTWTFVVANTGNVTLSGITLVDSLPGVTPVFGAWPDTAGVLAPGQSVTAVATSTVTQADVDAGALVNSATASGTPPRGAEAVSTAPSTVTLLPTGSLSIDKSLVAPAPDTVGETGTFQFTIVNTGNVTLTRIAIADELAGLSDIAYESWDGNPAGTLAPGDILTATATYTLRQSDIDRGSVANTATVSGSEPGGAIVTSLPDTVQIDTVQRTYQLTTGKSAVLAGSGAVGDMITYSLSAVNTGNTTVTGVQLADSLPGISTVVYGPWPREAVGTLLPGDRVTATARYVITQSDVDTGSVANTATSSGTTVLGDPIDDASDPVTTATVAQTPGLTLSKSGGLAPGATGRVGDTVRYSFTLTNSGNATLTGVAVNDPLPGLSAPVYTWPAAGPAGTLAPGATATATASYVLSQADVDSGAVVNTADGVATAPGAVSVTTTSNPVTVVVEPAASLSAVKTGVLRPGGIGAVGDIIDYAVTVTNTGNVTVYRGQLLDPLPGISDPVIDWPDPGAPGTLPVGESVVGRASYPLTQQDIDRGFISNIADVRAFSPNNQPVLATTNEVVINTVQPAPGLVVGKEAVVDGGGDVGDTIEYSFEVRNSGNISISGIELSDPLPGLVLAAIVWPDGNPQHILTPGESVATTGVYTITQRDVDAGVVVNTASATGTTARGAAVSFDSLVVTTPVAAAAPVLTVEKTGSLAADAAGVVGDVIPFQFNVANDGNVRLTGVQLADALPGLSAVSFGAWPGGVEGVLDPGESVTAAAEYTLTQADVDAGAVVNAVTASALPPRGSAVTDIDSASVPIVPTPDLEVVKLQSLDGEDGSLGDTVTYTFSIRNTGNVTLSGAVLADDLAGVSAPSITWPGTPRVLAPGETATATATYAITQADVDRGSVANTATVTAFTPSGASYSEASPAAVTTTVARADAVEITKTGATDGAGGVGDSVEYTLQLTNIGNVTLTGVTLADTKPGLSTPRIVWPAAPGELLPGATATATASYAITQADVDRGFVTNLASVDAVSPLGPVADDSGTITTPVATAAPLIDVTGEGAIAAGQTGRAGDRVNYTYSLRNTGNVTLTAAALADALPGLSAFDYSWPAGSPAGTLAPGATATATATYVLTQADVDAGFVRTTTTGSGDAAATPAAPATTATDSATTTVTIASAPLLTPVKTGRILAPGIGQVGDTIEYVLTITNDGNVTLYDGVLLDPLPGLGVPVITWPDPAAPGVLPPGSAVTGVATYVLTQADVDRGSISNIADVAAYTPGVAPSGHQPVTATSNEVVVRTVLPSPGIAVTKVGTPRTDTATGDTVDYSFGVLNTGNVTLTGVTLADPLTGVTLSDIVWPDAARPGEIAPGSAASAVGSYVVRLSDVDAGSIVNTATASGTSAGADGGAVTATATSTEPTAPIGAAVSLTKTVTLGAATVHRAGEPVSWGYQVTNTGNVTLTGITLADALPGISAAVWSSGATGPISLEPGQSATATATSTLTQDQIDAGSIGSTASVTASPPRGEVVTSTARADALISAAPAIEVDKSGVAEAPGGVGDTIDYTFEVSNPGNVTLSLVSLADQLGGVSAPVFEWPGDEGVLAPGASVTARAVYTISQADVDAGSVVNVATASGKPPVGDIISASSAASTTLTQAAAPQIVTTKTASVRGSGGVGSIIDYAFSVENTGNVTLTAVALSDPLAGLSTPAVSWPGAAGVLAPGEAATATATYAIRQVDVDRGFVQNTATATGTGPGGTVVDDASPAVVTDTVAASADLVIKKESRLEPGSVGDAGDDVQYLFTLTNGGNVTLTGIALTDPLPGLTAISYTWPTAASGTLAPGETATAIADYTLTQNDVDAGAVSNTVTSSATPPSGAAVTDVASNTQLLTPRAQLGAVKSGVLRSPGIGQVGDIVEYTLVATNTGNVTVTNGRLIDPLPGLSQPVIDWPGTPGTLRVGESVTGRATYALTQADVDRGFIENTARVGATAPDGQDVTQFTNRVVVSTVEPQPQLTVTKTGVAGGDGGVGDSVAYSFAIENTGNVTVTAVALSDELAGLSTPVITWPRAAGELRPGETATATASYAINQGDVDTGSVTNVATATGTPARGTLAPAAAGATTPTVDQRTSVTVANRGTLLSAAAPRAGDTVRWDYTFTNDGNVTLSSVAMADVLPGVSAPEYTWPGIPGQLAPGATLRSTSTYLLTQSDIDAGAVTSLVTGSATPPVGAPTAVTAPASLSLAPSAALSVTKTAAVAPGDNGLGDTVDYGFVIRNTGNVTLSDVRLVDALPGVAEPTVAWPGAVGVLAPGAEATASTTYSIQQEDVDSGSVENTATVTATPPTGPAVTAVSNTTSTPTEAQAPAIATAKSGTIVSGAGGVGSVIRYTFDVTNTGNVTLRLIDLEEGLAGVSAPAFTFPSATGILAPGGVAVGTATYTVTAADVDAGSVSNTATSYGTSPRGVVVSGVSNTFVVATAPAAPAITAAHAATLAPGTAGVLGDRVDYRFVLTNSGNVTLSGVSMSNSVADLAGVTFAWPGAAGVLAAGQSVVATASRQVTQTDVDAGAVTNVTTATGEPPAGAAVSASSEPSTVQLAAGSASLVVTKSGALTAGSAAVVGSTVRYSFRVTNTGTLSLSRIAVTDSLPGMPAVAFGAWPTATAGLLPPGSSVEATADYVVTQSDFDRGSVESAATASGATARGDSVLAASAPVVVPAAAPSPAIDVSKRQALAAGATGRAGDTVRFSFRMLNTGNVTLTGVSLADSQPRLSALRIAWPAAEGELAPGEVATAEAEYVLTQDDVDAGGISSSVSATGDGIRGPVVVDADAAAARVAPAPALSIDKSSTLQTVAQQGATVLYRIEVRNTGNVTQTGVEVDDTLPGLSTPAYAWPSVPGRLLPGELLVVTAGYVIGQADVDAGTISNTATAAGTSPTGVLTTVSDTEVRPVPTSAAIELTVSAEMADGAPGYPGDTVVFTYTARNTGTIALGSVRFADRRVGLSAFRYGPWPGADGVLLPGQSITATATYVIREGELGSLLEVFAEVTAVQLGTSIPVGDTAAAAVLLPDPPGGSGGPGGASGPGGVSPLPDLPQVLAYTGSDQGRTLLGGAAVLLLGLALTLISRKKKRKDIA